MRGSIGFLLAIVWLIVGSAAAAAAEAPHSLVLFIPDGLRAQIVDEKTAPTFARLRDEGVNFSNSHSLFPTFTTANASAFATGHYFGDTGDFSNTLFTNFAVQSAGGSVTPFL
jgi:predicted AlkP superfamily pyrophosphatase or phosphodiesterase